MSSASRGTTLLVAATVVVVGAVGAGIVVLGSPSTQRQERFDNVRVQDLGAIERFVTSFARIHKRLPDSFDTLTKEPGYLVPRGDGVFMVGATMLESDDAARISARSMLELLSAAYALHPAFGEAHIMEIGTAVRAAFPDNLPRLRRIGGTLHVNGLYRHGFLLAPALARRAAAVLLEGSHFAEVMDEDPRQRRLA